MKLPGSLHERDRLDMIAEIFGDQPVCFIGAHAAAAYAPERMTRDVRCLTTASAYEFATKRLRVSGYRKDGDLHFPTTALGLFGSRWTPEHGGPPIDLISTEQAWAVEAFSERAHYTKEGDRVIPLAYLVLMKLDAARSIDQADLSRMLGRLSDDELDTVTHVIEKHYSHDPAAREDVRQYAEVGRWEYETEGESVVRSAVDPPENGASFC
jgi:hypothetical protein